MSPLEFAILGLYFLTLVILAVFGLHRYIMVFLYFKHRDRRAVALPLPAQLPRVTVQLPIYNEMYVVDRLVDSVARIRYPRELLEIQVLDDSNDETVRDRPRRRRAPPRERPRHPVHPSRRPPRLQGGRARGGAEGRQGRVHPDLRRRLRGPARHPREEHRPVRRSEGRDGAGALGPHQPRLLAPHPGAVDPARRALHPRARRAQPRRPLLQLQRHRGHLAPRGDRRRRRVAARHADRGPRPLATARR